MPTSLYIQQQINQITTQSFVKGITWYFVLIVIICLFLGGGMGMWTNTHCFDFQIFWSGGTTGMTYLYYIILYYIYYIIYTGPYLHI